MKIIAYFVKPVPINNMSIYLNINYINSSKSYKLYAYTDDKEIAKRFEKERDMSYFIKKKIDVDNIESKYEI